MRGRTGFPYQLAAKKNVAISAILFDFHVCRLPSVRRACRQFAELNFPGLPGRSFLGRACSVDRHSGYAPG